MLKNHKTQLKMNPVTKQIIAQNSLKLSSTIEIIIMKVNLTMTVKKVRYKRTSMDTI